jgi:hypothetical protein
MVSRHIRSNLIGYVALFFALGFGSAWAATELEKNEVKSKHIGAGQVKNADIANDAVTSPKVADGSLLGEDFANGQLPVGAQGERGPQGTQGERGLQGEQGTQGVQGEDGEPGTAVAHVELNADGAISTTNGSSGITAANITHPSTGVYCFKNLPAGTKTAMVAPSGLSGTAGYRDTSVAVSFDARQPSPNLTGCEPLVDRARVVTVDLNNAAEDTGGAYAPTPSNEPFVIWFED